VEWDIESIIPMLYKELNIKFVFQHLKSHPDEEAPAANLSLETLAMEYKQEDKTCRPMVSLFPIAGKSTTHHSGSFCGMQDTPGHPI
jgi:hypothetical protein